MIHDSIIVYTYISASCVAQQQLSVGCPNTVNGGINCILQYLNMAGRRRNSFVQIATNPLELKGGLAGASASAPRIESLADAMPILADEFGELVGTMKSLS